MGQLRRRHAGWVIGCWLLVVSCGCAGTTADGSSASCAGPVLSTIPNAAVFKPVVVSPGQTLRIYGYGYETCHDTNHQPPASAFTGLTVLVIQGHSQHALATVSARTPRGTFAITVHLPSELRSGPATIRTSQQVEEPIHLQVR
jgi:hypothetical protein